MNELVEIKAMLEQALPALKQFSEALPALQEFSQWNEKRKQQEREEAEGRSASVKEIEAWQKRQMAEQQSQAEYAAELEKHIFTGSMTDKPVRGEFQ